jgi:hypothetical protein
MGLFSAIGSFFGPVGTVFGAIADTSIAKKQVKRQNAAAEAAYKRQLAQDKKNRQLAKQDASNKFTDLTAAAKKAGINPLTALRATGGAGFGMYGGMTAVAPVLSRFNFATTFATNVGKQVLNYKQNAPIDKYNAEVRKLELEQRRLDIKLGKQQLNALRSVGVGIGSNKGNNPDATNSRTAVTTPAGTTTPANVSDAEAYEQRYGDIMQEVAGIGILLSDLYNTGLISAETAFGKKPSFNNPGRGEMVKRRLTTPIFSTPLGRTTPGYGEQWSMYAP